MSKATWKWTRANEGYLTAKGESARDPRARIYTCLAAPRRGRFIWTVTIAGMPFAVCATTTEAMRLGREFSKAVR